MLDDGLTENVPRRIALQLIRSGDLVKIKDTPLTVSIPKHKNFAEEQRHCSGRKIPGVSKPEWNDKASMSSGLRVRPPRSVMNQDYVTVLGWVRQAQKVMADKEDKEREEKEKEKRRRRKKRKRRR